MLISLLILSTWRKPIKFGNSIPFATKINTVFGCNNKQSQQSSVSLQSSILSNPQFHQEKKNSNKQYVIKDFNGVEKVLQLPSFEQQEVLLDCKRNEGKEN